MSETKDTATPPAIAPEKMPAIAPVNASTKAANEGKPSQLGAMLYSGATTTLWVTREKSKPLSKGKTYTGLDGSLPQVKALIARNLLTPVKDETEQK